MAATTSTLTERAALVLRPIPCSTRRAWPAMGGPRERSRSKRAARQSMLVMRASALHHRSTIVTSGAMSVPVRAPRTVRSAHLSTMRLPRAVSVPRAVPHPSTVRVESVSPFLEPPVRVERSAWRTLRRRDRRARRLRRSPLQRRARVRRRTRQPSHLRRLEPRRQPTPLERPIAVSVPTFAHRQWPARVGAAPWSAARPAEVAGCAWPTPRHPARRQRAPPR